MFDRISKGLWWDRALTLVEGCTPVSPGCDNCWSASLSQRFKNRAQPENHYHALTDRKRKWTGKIICREDRLALPLKVKKPTVWAVWNDLFHEDVPDDFITNALKVFFACPQHIFIVLTKRPNRASKYFQFTRESDRLEIKAIRHWPYKNVWLGVTAENQEQADKRLPILWEIPAAVRLVCIEPMIGPVDLALNRGLCIYWEGNEGKIKTYYGSTPFSFTERDRKGWVQYTGRGVDWVICGCESGPRRRPTEWTWIKSLKDQCKAASVPFFLKQGELGGKVVKSPYPEYLEIPKQ